jgi:hypothetical protein
MGGRASELLSTYFCLLPGDFFPNHEVKTFILNPVRNPTAITGNKYPTIVEVLRLENKL